MEAVPFLTQLQRRKPGTPLAPGYAFLGRELFSRDGCKKALIDAALTPEEREGGLVQYDLSEVKLDEMLDDARTLSLFAQARVIVGYNAENAVPRTRDETDEEGGSPGAGALESYFSNPTPGVTLLFEAVRFDWDDRDEKKKLERVEKFFKPVPVLVELHKLDERSAVEGAKNLARQQKLNITDALLGELGEALGYDMSRIANEISKLAMYANGRELTREELATLVPEARTSGIFELTDALASRNRTRALEILDTLTRTDVYLPLQVNFLAALFRYALAIHEAGAKTEGDVSRLFAKLGLPIWPSRARQALDTAKRFTRAQLQRAMVLLFETDRDLRRERPDDRVVMERLVWELTRSER